MDEHFRAFSFVDRIASVQSGVSIRGSYAIPASLEAFPGSLIAEAVGQLAAWAAMAAHNFERRPVAGLATSVELLASAHPGQVLDLAVELDSVDEDAVSYSGTAQANGSVVIRLLDCVGPMVPVAEFDDPQALRDRFAVLSGRGAEPGGFRGLPAFGLERNGGEVGRRTRAAFRVPASAPFFADHFPRRPVFPGSLLMHLNLQLAAALTAEIAPSSSSPRWRLQTIMDMKLRAFIAPGETLELEAKLSERSEESAAVAAETRRGKEVVGSARLLFVPEGRP